MLNYLMYLTFFRMDANFAMGLKRYSRGWKLRRRFFTQHINSTTVFGQFARRQLMVACKLLHNLLVNPTPASMLDTFNHTSASIVLGIAYGYDVQSEKDPLVRLAGEWVGLVLDGCKPKFLVNVFPFCMFRNIVYIN
jgi:hypothetical protein